MVSDVVGKWKRTAMVKAILVAAVAFALAKAATAGEAEIRKSVEALYPQVKVSSVVPTEIKGIYEVISGQEVVYADETGKYLFFGELVDASRKMNLTEMRKDKLSAIEWKDLPLDLAIKTVRGDGSRMFATFEDPNCGYCKRLHESVRQLDNFTLYTFLTPILSEDSKAKSKAIWCAPDRSKAFSDWMERGAVPANTGCDTPIDKVLVLAQRLGVKGTPTIFFESGKRLPGYLSAPQLEQALVQHKTLPTTAARSN